MNSKLLRRSVAALALAVIGLGALVISGQAASYYQPGSKGFDVSFPQCGSRLPTDGAFAVVGVNYGLPWSSNPCVEAQYEWAKSLRTPPSFYTNTANPGPPSRYWNLPGAPRTCSDPTSYTDSGCSYNYGWHAAAQSFDVAVNASSTTAATQAFWWLDVETMNSWEGSDEANAATIQGYIDYFRSKGVTNLGVYSTPYQWSLITGGYRLEDMASWVAGARSERTAQANCRNTITGGPVLLSQYGGKGYGKNVACNSTTTSTSTSTSFPRDRRFN